MRTACSLSAEQSRIKPQDRLLAHVDTYADTLGLHSSRKPPFAVMRELEQHAKRGFRPRPLKSEQGQVVGHIITTPALAPVMMILDELGETHPFSIFRNDIAFDFEPAEGVTRDEVIEFLLRQTTMRNSRRSDRVYEFEGTHYAVKQKGRATPISKNWVLYFGKPSKLTGEDDVIHGELQSLKSDVVKRNGVFELRDVLKITPQQYFEKNIIVTETTDRYFARFMKATLKAIRAKDTRTSALSRRYASPEYVEKRATAMWKHARLDRASEFMKRFPRKGERLKRLKAPFAFGDELMWRLGDGRCLKGLKLGEGDAGGGNMIIVIKPEGETRERLPPKPRNNETASDIGSQTTKPSPKQDRDRRSRERIRL